MALTVGKESAASPEAISLLSAREVELAALYPPEQNFSLDLDDHKKDDIVFVVARENGLAVGCGALKLCDGYGELKSMYVAPVARGKRIGAEILGALETMARRLGLSQAKLETGVNSPAAIRMYERAGYCRCPRFGDYPDVPLSVFMRKKLTL